MPPRVMEILFSDNRDSIFNEFTELESDLSHDWFTDYFQSTSSDRKTFMQDFTPPCVCDLVSKMAGEFKTVCDICSGTGGLTISLWNTNKTAFYHCEELSKTAIPLLLFNLSIRNVNGEVVDIDVLKNKINSVYRLTSTDRYSRIEITDNVSQTEFDICISNPPYSCKWEPEPFDARFFGYAEPPKSKADYAFVLHAISKLNENGKALFILPHGVLFRGNREKEIRECLIKNIDTIVGLPDKMFLNTSIPVLIMAIEKRETDKVYFVSAEREFEKQSKTNRLTTEHIGKILTAYKLKNEIDKYAHLASYEEIKVNDYNLNIPRYVDSFEKIEVPDLAETVIELLQVEKEIHNSELIFFETMKQLCGNSKESSTKLGTALKEYGEYINDKYNANM